MIKLELDNLCTGCSACAQVCPFNAIKMVENNEGFLYPQIDKNLCKNCNKCEEVCQIGKKDKLLNDSKRKYYAAYQINEEERLKSSSGGIASLIAKYITEHGGYFCSAAFINGKLQHIIIDNFDDFKYMRGSKYFQSEISGCYTKIKQLLENEKVVAVVGTPCQIAGLKLYLGKKEYKNLYTIDLICHGVPPLKLFKKFVKENDITENLNDNILINFRNKKHGWRDFSLSLEQNGKEIFNRFFGCTSLGKCFYNDLSLRNSCYECMFANTKRCSDLTIGDFWGIESYKKVTDDNKGYSIISVNSSGGGEFVLSKLTSMLNICSVPEKYVLQWNLQKPSPKHGNRDKFFQNIDKQSLNDLCNNFTNKEKNVAIMNFFWQNYNYGAVLTAYALNKYINNLGYNAYNINYIPSFDENFDKYTSFVEFRKKYIPLTSKCKTFADLQYLNHYTGNFIVGSDQVFRWDFVHNDAGVYFLNFVNNTNKRIAYSASFGKSEFESDKKVIEAVGLCLSKFNDISIREDSGVNILRNQFHLKGVQTLDPVFFFNKNHWEKIASDRHPENKIVCYFVDNRIKKIIEPQITAPCTELYCMPEYSSGGYSVEDYLSAINKADFIITDSFHTCCFCLIFNKQFVCLAFPNSAARIESLFKVFEISESHLVKDFNKFNLEECMKNKIDYSNFDKILKKNLEFSEKFIKNALERENEKQYDKFYFLHKDIIKFKLLLYKLIYIRYKFMYSISFRKKSRLRYKNKVRNTKILYELIKNSF